MSEQPNDKPPADRLGRPMMEARGRTWTLHHLLGAADLLGCADGLWSALDDAASCEAYADEEGFDVDDAELQEALDTFRYERQLETAEETERWLAERELSEDGLIAWLRRAHWLARFSAGLSSVRASYPAPAGQADEALWSELVLSKRLGPLSTEVARRLVSPEPGRTEREAAALSTGRAPRHELPPEWDQELMALDSSYRRVCGEALSTRRIEEAIRARRMELTRVDLEAARFASLGTAREAHLCVTQDREDFGQTVLRSGARREDRELYLEDASEALAPALISASPGEVFLVDEEEGPLLVRVRARRPPSADDPLVFGRLRDALLDRVFSPLVEAGVRFLFPME